MDALVTMSAPPALAAHQPSLGHQARELAPPGSSHGPRQQQTISVRSPTTTTTTTSTSSSSRTTTAINGSSSATGAHTSPHKETGTTAAGATVFVGGSVPDVVVRASSTSSTRIPEVQLANGSRETAAAAVAAVSQNHQNLSSLQQQKPAHVVKIKINPSCDSSSTTSRVVSAVRLNLEDIPTSYDLETNGVGSINSCNNSVIICTNNNINGDSEDKIVVNHTRSNGSNSSDILVNGNSVSSETCVRISVKSNSCDYSGSESSSEELHTSHTSIREDHAKDADMVQQRNVPEPLNTSRTSSSCFYYSSPLSTMVMSSGQCSPSETLDSGTCSDLDGTPPPLPKKKSSSTVMVGAGGTTASNSHHHHHHPHQRHDRTGSLTSSGAEVDSDDNESSISCDSLNSGEVPLNGNVKFRVSRSLELRTAKQHRMDKESKKDTIEVNGVVTAIEDAAKINNGHMDDSEIIVFKERGSSGNKSPSVSPPASGTSTLSKASSTPRIRSPEVSSTRRSSTCSSTSTSTSALLVNECTYEERRREQECNNINAATSAESLLTNGRCATKYVYEDDRYYKFHINEREEVAKDEASENKEKSAENDDECFAGYKILEREAIRSAKGTVRGVKNRVRAGIATFLQKPSTKNYKAKDAGKVVVYTTTMGIVRETYYRCILVKQILRTHMVKYEERDMYMSTESQTELRDRIGCEAIQVPHLFIDGQYIGDAETVERLNETGELRLMLKPYKSMDACTTCKVCGGFRLLPCPVCNGSKKSVHRNDFTAEFIALKCMNCDEVGLVRCRDC